MPLSMKWFRKQPPPVISPLCINSLLYSGLLNPQKPGGLFIKQVNQHCGREIKKKKKIL